MVTTRIASVGLSLGAINLAIMAMIYVIAAAYADGEVDLLFYGGLFVQALGSIILMITAVLLFVKPTKARLKSALIFGAMTGAAALTAIATYQLGNRWGAAWMFYGPMAVVTLSSAAFSWAALRSTDEAVPEQVNPGP